MVACGSVRARQWAAVVLVIASLLLWSAVRRDAAPWLRGPAPYPPEWQWGYEPKPMGRAWPAAVCAAAAVLFVWARSRPPLLVALAVVLGWCFQLALLHVEAGGARAELVRRTASGSFTSYLKVAASGAARDPAAFLARHAQLLPSLRRSARHAATHPPGPVLLFRGLIAACDRLPSLTRATASLVPIDPASLDPPLAPSAMAAAFLGASLLGIAGAAAAWPAAALARMVAGDAPIGARVGALWSVLPGPALMSPELDQALALPVAASSVALAAALAPGARPPSALLGAVAAGALAGLAGFFSYGALLLVALGGLAVVAFRAEGGAWPRRALLVVGIATATAVAALWLPAIFGYRPLASASAALAIHREQFTARRGYALWLLFNPLDLALFVGPPVAAVGLWRLARAVRQPRRPRDRFRLAVAAGLLLLVASGVVRGEMGRILIPFMPVLLVASCAEPEGPSERSELPLLAMLLSATAIVFRLSWELP
ncbi:MAG TPA: hypothetical protein VGQ78_04640 [Vicinamibacteria bacterium]|nr:hypothetical protein [Vicinamibacteria bacterium]